MSRSSETNLFTDYDHSHDLFLEAAQDFRYLLGKGYARPGALMFVGNHYQLPKGEREILNRGVYPEAEARTRRERLVTPERLKGRAVGVDGHNVLITMESALLGRELVACDDGLIRDTAGLSNSYRPSEITDRALALVLNYLERRGAASVLFFLDAPMSHSGELAAKITAVMAGRGFTGRASAEPVPEAQLRSFPGVVATSDSALIDRVSEPFDLAGNIIREMKPQPQLRGLMYKWP